MLTTEMLGIYNIALSVFAVLTTILSSGIAITISRYVSINHFRNNKEKNNSLIFSSLILTIIIAIIICFVLFISEDVLVNLLSGLESYMIILYLIPALISCAIYTPFKSYLNGREMFFQSSIVELVEQILRIIVCFVVYLIFKDIPSIYAPVIAMVVAGILSTIMGIIIYKKAGGGLKVGKPKFKKLIKKSTPITIVRLLSSLIMPLISIIIPIMLVKSGYTQEQALSLLGIAMGMTLPLLSIPSTIIGSLSMALMPQITTLYEAKNNNTIHNQINSSLKFTIIISFICVPVFVAIGEPICEIVFANSQAGTLLAKASWVMIPTGISQLTTTILNSMGYEKSTFIYYLISSVFMAICIIFLPNIIGIESIIWALGTSSVVVSLFNIIKIQKLLNKKYHVLSLIIISTLLAIPISFLISNLFNICNIIFNNFISICISAIVGVVAYFLLYAVFGIIDIKVIRNTIKTKLGNKKKLKKV